MDKVRSGGRWIRGGLLAATGLLAACGGSAAVGQDPLELGRQQVQRMSDALAGAQSFTFTTAEVHTRPGREDQVVERKLTREIAVRRPDGLWMRAVGDREGEVWYDGESLVLRSDAHQVWARVQVPESMDEAIDYVAERFAHPMPMADLFYSSPYDAFMTEDTTGGWVGVEDIGGTKCHHLSFEQAVVAWQLWVAEAEPALPCRLIIEYREMAPGSRSAIDFADWNLTPTASEERFVAQIPEGYERIGVVEYLPPDEVAAPTATSPTAEDPENSATEPGVEDPQ